MGFDFLDECIDSFDEDEGLAEVILLGKHGAVLRVFISEDRMVAYG